MNVNLERLDNHKVALTITVEAAELDKGIKASCKALANKYSIPGFRKGKAPRRILENYLGGKDAIMEEAFNRVANSVYDKALAEADVEPVTAPNVEIITLEEGKDLVFKATFTAKPEVVLGQYKELVVPKAEISVTDEEVEEQINNLRNHHAKYIDAKEDAKVENGNIILLDFKGEVDGVAFPGGEAEDYQLEIGSHSFIDTFEDQLVGLAVGEEKDVHVTFPEEYQAKDLAGKAAVFHCKVKNIKIKEVPALTDEFVKEHTSFESVEDLKTKTKARLLDTKTNEANIKRRNDILKLATDNAKMDVPEVMITTKVDNMISEMAAKLEAQGMALDMYLKYTGMDMDKLKEQYKESADIAVHTDLMLDAVAKAENIKVEDADINAEIALLAASYGSTPQEVAKIIRQNDSIGNLMSTVSRKKVANFIIDSAKEA